MEQIVWIVALVVTGPLVGIELGVAAFVGPLAAKLPDSGFRVMRGGGSRWLGALMPCWYLGATALIVAVAVLRSSGPMIAAIVIMAATVLLSVTVLVPIYNRVGRWRTDDDVDRSLTARWDAFHRLRVAMLAVVFVLLAVSAR